MKDLPKPRSQSGRRLFVLTNDELWLDMNGMFKRWILRANGATFAGDLPIDLAYYRGELPSKDSGAYEVIEGSFERQWFRLWFSGRVLQGEWTLEKIEKSDEHRSWRLAPKRG